MATVYMREGGQVFRTDNPQYHEKGERLTVAAGKLALRSQARAALRAMLRDEQDVYALQDASGRGMRRYVRLFVVKVGQLVEITGRASDATDIRWDSSGRGLVFNGCGYSATNEAVNSLARNIGRKLHEEKI